MRLLALSLVLTGSLAAAASAAEPLVSADWLEGQLELIAQVGEANYLATGNLVAGSPKIFGQLLPIIQAWRPANLQA